MATLATDRPGSAPASRNDPHRRSLMAKIHVAKKQLRMVEDDYRQLLFEATGRSSLTECDTRQLEAVVAALKGKGFVPVPRGAGGRRPATHKVALKARAMWISLHQLGVVNNPSDEALEAFARRQLKCETFQWARQSEGYRVIEALKAMARRAGWQQSDLATQKPLGPLALKESLCLAILRGLKGAGEVPADWSLNTAAYRLCGIECGKDGPMTASDYEELAAGLGAKLRDSMARQLPGEGK